MIAEESLYFRYNIDENGTPISLKIDKENKQVTSAHCTIQLEQVPDELHRVAMFNENGQPMTEVFNRDEVAPNSFYVDYGNGIAYFHSSQSGKFKLYDYYGKGLIMIGSSRIFDEHDVTGKGIVLSLQEMIDKGKECIQTLFYMGDAKKIVDKLDEKINTGTVLHENLTNDIEIATSLQEDLHSDIVEANTFREQLNQDIANGAVLSSELRQNVIDGENINADLEYNLVEGQGAIDLIRGTGNTAKIITTSDWVGTAPDLSYTWNHGLGTKNLTVEVFDNDTNETLFWTTTLVDNNNIKIESDEAKNIRIVLSAKYHMGGMDTKEEIIAARKGKTDLKTKIDEMDISLEANLNSINSAKEEIIAARKGKVTLKDKIDEIDTNIENKIDKININSLTVSSNSTDVINSTILTAYNMKIPNVFIPKLSTDYVIDKEIILRSGVRLYSNGAVLKPSGDIITTKSPIIRNYSFDATGYNGDTDISINGFVIDCNNQSCTGIALAHTSNCIISNNIIKNIIVPAHGMDLAGNKNLIIDNNVLINCQRGGIQIDACMVGSIPVMTLPALNEDDTVSLNIKITNNYFDSCLSGAIHLHKKGHSNISIIDNYFINCSSGIVDDNNYNSAHKNVKILNNYFEGNGENSSAIVFYAGHNNLYVDKNTFKSCKNGIILSQNNVNNNLYNYLKITNNTFDSCTNAQIKIENGYKCLLDGNLIRNFGVDDITEVNGIEILKSNYLKIINNDIYNMSGKLMRNGIKWGTTCDNIILSNNSLVTLENGVVGGTQSNFITISGNTIRNCNSKGIVIESFSSQMKNISIEGNTIEGTLDYAIRTANTEGMSITNNIINNSTLQKACISLNTFEKGVVTSNVVNGGTIGISISSNSTTKKGLNVISNNMITASTNGVELLNGSLNNIIAQNVINGQLTITDTTNNIVVNNKVVA